eukprot:scaffold5532_cov180-Amphora_coffeaeformis.AAC.6
MQLGRHTPPQQRCLSTHCGYIISFVVVIISTTFDSFLSLKMIQSQLEQGGSKKRRRSLQNTLGDEILGLGRGRLGHRRANRHGSPKETFQPLPRTTTATTTTTTTIHTVAKESSFPAAKLRGTISYFGPFQQKV